MSPEHLEYPGGEVAVKDKIKGALKRSSLGPWKSFQTRSNSIIENGEESVLY